RGRPGALAGRGHPGPAGRLVVHRGPPPRPRPGTAGEPPPGGDRAGAVAGRTAAARPATTPLHRLPPAPPPPPPPRPPPPPPPRRGGRPDPPPDTQGAPHPGKPGRATDPPRQTEDQPRRHPVPDPVRGRARRPPHRGPCGDLPTVQRGLPVQRWRAGPVPGS